jgi:hypothetical protein
MAGQDMRKTYMALAIGFFIAAESLSVTCAQPQAVVEVIGRNEPIPLGYKTYSLFLICNPQWLDPAQSSGLTELYSQFQAFGRSIGGDQAAVWFWRTTVRKGWENSHAPADVIDVERSTRFCRAWKLKPSEGPYIVVTLTRPDEEHLEKGLPGDSAVFTLGGMKPAEISALLAKLTDSLLLNGRIDESLTAASSHPSSTAESDGASSPSAHTATTADNSPSASTSALWIRMLSAAQQLAHEFGCAWTFKVDAGPLSAVLKSCEGSS